MTATTAFASPRLRISALVLAVSIAAGASAALVSRPSLVAAGLAALMIVLICQMYGGALGVMALMVAAVALVPTVNSSSGAVIRDVLIVALVALAALQIVGPASHKVPRLVRPLVFCLGGMVVLGFAVTAFTSTGATDYLKQISQASGQPLVYVCVLVVLVWLLRSHPGARRALVAAWCVSVVAEALYVAEQLVTGAAYDALRGYTRAQGSMGSDFLGTFAAMGLLAGVYLRSIGGTARYRLLGVAAVFAGGFSLIASISRGPLVGLALAVLYLLVAGGSRTDRRKRLVQGIGVAIVVGAGLYAMQGLWAARLNAKNTSSFDRATTWVDGAQIVGQAPVLGVGPRHVSAVVATNTRYSATPTNANPSNVWLFAAAAEGVPYALLLFWATVALVRLLRRRRPTHGDRYLIASIIAGGVVFFSDNLFNHPENMLYMLVAVAILGTAPKAEPTRTNLAEADRQPLPRWRGLPGPTGPRPRQAA